MSCQCTNGACSISWRRLRSEHYKNHQVRTRLWSLSAPTTALVVVVWVKILLEIRLLKRKAEWQHSCFVIRRSRVLITYRRPNILIEIVWGFTQSLEASTGIIRQLPLVYFPVHYSLIVSFDAVLSRLQTASLNKKCIYLHIARVLIVIILGLME
jgi:hypothetical protein